MIPQTNDTLITDFDIEEVPTRTFKLDLNKLTLTGTTDENEAMIQAIFLILNTEKYQHIIYSWNYGIQTTDLFGKDISFVIPELKRRITEALLTDERILSVDNFSFESGRKSVCAEFNVTTVFGEIEAVKAVNI